MRRLTVEAIEDPRGLRAFIRFPEILYRDDPCWVPPLRRDERARLSASNPFFAHADARLFLARWDREVVGRMAAIVDRWHLERWKDGAGFFDRSSGAWGSKPCSSKRPSERYSAWGTAGRRWDGSTRRTL